MSDIQLVVQGDDLGMCHSVNEGIQQAFDNGIVTQTVAMAPAPWIEEGVAFAKASGIHAGMHCTLNSEWEYLRWRPFTDGASLTGPDGGFHKTLATAMKQVDPEEASAELDAQFSHLNQIGLPPAFFDFHMGPVSLPAMSHVVEKHARPFLYPVTSSHYSFASLQMLSHHSQDKLAWMLAYVDGLGSGDHFLCTHPAVASDELSSLTPREAENNRWMDDYRISDLEVLTSNAVRERLVERDVALISVAELVPVTPTESTAGS